MKTTTELPASGIPAAPARLPRQIPFIMGNEACERFSFYGMRNILVQFLVSSVILAYLPESERELAAKDVFHSFVIGVYFFPLLGGWLSDRYFGKYNTVMWFSLVYCAGHACLAMFDDNRTGFYTGLFLIALGSGGIKPLVVSFVGDQFTRDNKHLAKVVFDFFYWTINFGSFFASLLMPIFLSDYGPAVAFGIPGVLMFLATVIFWLGRGRYVRVPPSRGDDPDSFMHVARTALVARGAFKDQVQAALQGDPVVAEHLGRILDLGVENRGVGDAADRDRFTFEVTGDRGRGQVVVNLFTVDGREELGTGTLRLEDGRELEIGSGIGLRPGKKPTSSAEGEGRLGLTVAVVGAALAVLMLLAWALRAISGLDVGWPDDFGFVITACLALLSLIAFGGIGTSMQLERARGKHPDAAVDGVRAVLRVLIVFALVTPFWSLFDQKASTWVLQGKAMAPWELFDLAALQASSPLLARLFQKFSTLEASQMQALNPLLVMLIIPFNNLVLYPALRRMGWEPTALKRMGWGIVFASFAWVFAGVIQLWIDDGAQVSLSWQVAPYLLLTFGEVLVSATALEFAYSQATQAMKGVIMAFWYLTSTFGSLWVLLTNAGVRNETVLGHIASTGLSENAFLMFFFAGFALVAAAVFAAYARTYPMQDNYRVA